jgi:ribonuclease R
MINNPKQNIYTGNLTLTKSGNGIVYVPELNTKVEIKPQFLKTALNRDTVSICLQSKQQGSNQISGEVISVIKEAKRGFAGKIVQENGIWFVHTDDPRMPFAITIPANKRKNAKPGQKVFVKIDYWKNRKQPPFGVVIKVLGTPGNIDSEMHGIALEKGFDWEFPPKVQKTAEKLSRNLIKDELVWRKDLRGLTTFTIDPEDAKDFDDALSFEINNDNTYTVGIHIADVSHYVQEDDEIDKEAFKRATSVYLVDRTIPMLPEILSNDLCSLKPNEDKRAFSAIFTLNKQGEVLNEWFGKTLIHSDKRFTYEEAQAVLDSQKGTFFSELETLNTLAKKLNKKRIKEGSLIFETEEVKFTLNKKGKPIAVHKKKRQDVHKLIEEFMLLANQHVAKFCGFENPKKTRLSIYRIHEKPTQEKTQDLVRYIEMLGYTLPLNKGQIHSVEVNKLFSEVESSLKNQLQTMMVRSMQKARYSTKNVGHFGLAFPFYTHFTSPIRRYPDLMIHRILQTYLQKKSLAKISAKQLEDQCEHCSGQEKEAMEAERKSVKIKQVEYMADRIGQVFKGHVTGITNWGIYVEEQESKAEGMVALRNIHDDLYIFNPNDFVIKGEKNGKEFKIGDTVLIKVKSVDLEEYTIDYVLKK